MKPSTSTRTRVKVLCLPQGTIEFPSTRYRLYQFLPALRQRGVAACILEYPTTRFARALFAVRLIVYLLWADAVFIQKRIPTPRIRRLISRLNGNVLLDFDDAIYTINPAKRSELPDFDEAVRGVENGVKEFLRECRSVVTGNKYLAAWAEACHDDVHVVPTVVDPESIPPRPWPTKGDSPITVGWIGQSNNLYYVSGIDAVFVRLHARYGDKVRLKVICNEGYQTQSAMEVINARWSLQSEVAELAQCDVGIMPLVDDEWNRGKCAFKMIFYMLLGIPVVTSPVGVNSDIIEDGRNGFVARDLDEWEDKLSRLIESAQLRKTIGAEGRRTVERDFSLSRHADRLAEILARTAQG